MNIKIIDGEYNIEFNDELYMQRVEDGPNSWPLGAAERVIVALCERVEELEENHTLMVNNDNAQEQYIEKLEEHCKMCADSGEIVKVDPVHDVGVTYSCPGCENCLIQNMLIDAKCGEHKRDPCRCLVCDNPECLL